MALFRIQETEDGQIPLLWISPREDQSSGLPLLRSTRKLLRFLQESIPDENENVPGIEGNTEEPTGDDPMSVDSEAESTIKMEDTDEKKLEDANLQDSSDTDEINGESLAAIETKEQGINPNPDDAVEDKSTDDTTPVEEPMTRNQRRKKNKKKNQTEAAPDNEPFQKLHRNHNSVDIMLKALDNIREFYREDRPTESDVEDSPRGDGSRLTKYSRRILAIQNQRDRLHEKLSTMDDDSLSDGDNEAPDQMPVEEEMAWIRLVCALNSLSILSPCLLRMLRHKRRNDASLVIRGIQLKDASEKGKRNKGTCWLLGDRVFDTCKVTICKRLYTILFDLWEKLVGAFEKKDIQLEDLGIKWRNAMTERMKEIATLASFESMGSKDPCDSLVSLATPFYSFSEKEQTRAMDLSNAMDQKFGVNQEKDAKQHKSYLEAVERLHAHIAKLVRQVYSDASLSIYGSCLSDLSLGKSSDVDLSLYIEKAQRNKEAFHRGDIDAKKYEREMKSAVYKVCRKLEGRQSEFRDMNPITRARVPVVSGTYMKAENPYAPYDGALAFDICFLNDIAVANSSLLREYTMVHPRLKHLIMQVKRWAKAKKIASAKDNSFSSYTWTNLVVFYLQSLHLVPNLQSPDLLEQAGIPTLAQSKNRWHSINNLDTRYVPWEQAKSFWSPPSESASYSVTALLYGFYSFYASRFQGHIFLISIKRGGNTERLLPKTVFHKCQAGLVIEDPFETYDSHCPHNLSIHASAEGMQKILSSLKEAEAHMEAVFRDQDQTIDTVESLWPGDTHSTGRAPQEKGGNSRTANHTKSPQKQQATPNKKRNNKKHDDNRNGHATKSNENGNKNNNNNKAPHTPAGKNNATKDPQTPNDKGTPQGGPKGRGRNRNRGRGTPGAKPNAQTGAPDSSKPPLESSQMTPKGGRGNKGKQPHGSQASPAKEGAPTPPHGKNSAQKKRGRNNKGGRGQQLQSPKGNAGPNNQGAAPADGQDS